MKKTQQNSSKFATLTVSYSESNKAFTPVKHGFTLIELLVIIAIIALLAAILFPVFAQAKAKARQTSCVSNMKQISLAIIQYKQDHDELMPPFRTGEEYKWMYQGTVQSYGTPIVQGTGAQRTGTPWPALLEPYLKNFDVLHCPSNDGVGVFDSGSHQGAQVNYTDYGINADYLYKTRDGMNCYNFTFYANPNPSFPSALPVADSDIASPAATILLTDVKVIPGGAYLSFPHAFYTNFATSPATPTAPDACPIFPLYGWGKDSYYSLETLPKQFQTSTGQFFPLHNGGGNVAFVDGHVKWYTPAALAAGTNWRPGMTENAITITDRSQYLWDRN